MILGRAALRFKRLISLLALRFLFNNHSHKGKKIMIFGYGRSGSTLLAKILETEGVLDLGEPLRIRKNEKTGFVYKRSAVIQLNAFASRGFHSGVQSVVAHVKPYHTAYWGDSWEDFLDEARNSGWIVIGLTRSFPSRWKSECRARARGTWVGDTNAKKSSWIEELNWANYAEESIISIQFHKMLESYSGLDLMVNYEIDLETRDAQASLCDSLSSIGLKSSMTGLIEKHAVLEVDDVEMANLVFDCMKRMHDSHFQLINSVGLKKC